jgi:hypothetical protein
MSNVDVGSSLQLSTASTMIYLIMTSYAFGLNSDPGLHTSDLTLSGEQCKRALICLLTTLEGAQTLYMCCISFQHKNLHPCLLCPLIWAKIDESTSGQTYCLSFFRIRVREIKTYKMCLICWCRHKYTHFILLSVYDL